MWCGRVQRQWEFGGGWQWQSTETNTWCGRFQRQWEFGRDWQQHLHVRWQFMKRNDVPNMENEIPMAPFVFTTETARNDTTSSSGTVTQNHCHAHSHQLLTYTVIQNHFHIDTNPFVCFCLCNTNMKYHIQSQCHVDSCLLYNIAYSHTESLSCWLLSTIQYNMNCHADSVNWKFGTFAVTLTLNTANQSFHSIFWCMVIYHKK